MTGGGMAGEFRLSISAEEIQALHRDQRQALFRGVAMVYDALDDWPPAPHLPRPGEENVR